MKQYKRAILKISGSDAREFLQNIITNDINSSENFYSLLLNPSGRFLFDFFISYKDENFYIDIDSDDSDSFIKKLNQIKLRKNVEIEDLSDIFAFAYTIQPLEDAFIAYRDPRYMKLGYRNIIDTKKISSFASDDYLRDKFQYSIPDGSYDLIKEKSFPQEFGLDKLFAINFKKGCYVGQEVVSRIRTQGVVRKEIFKVVSSVDFNDIQNFDIYYKNEKIGIVTSAQGKIGIAQIFLFDDFNINLIFQIDNRDLKITYPEWRQ